MQYKDFQLQEVLIFQAKSRRKAGDGLKSGAYPFFTSSQNQTKWFDVADHNQESIILGTGGAPSVHCAKAFSTSADVFVLTPRNTEVSAKYIFFYLLGHKALLERDFKGAGLKHLSSEYVKKLSIPLPIDKKGNPDLAEQKRLAQVMDEIEGLKKKRQLADDKMAKMVPAIFIKMFGDPKTNPHNWPTQKLRTISTKFSDGPFGSNLKSSHYQSSGARVIRLQNIGIGYLNDKDKAYISFEHFQTLKKHECLPGDVLVATLGDPNLRAMILPHDVGAALNKADCVQIRPKTGVSNSEYICWLLNMPGTLTLATSIIAGQTRSRISMGRLADLEIPLPPIELQDKFAKAIANVEAFQKQQQAATSKINQISSALLSQAFA